MGPFIIKICIIVSFGDHVIQAQEIDKKTETEESPIINVKASFNGNPLLSQRQYRGLLDANEHFGGVLCKLNNRVFKSGTSILDGCNVCRCIDGIVACAGGPIKCRYYQGETTRRPPNGCSFEDNYRYNGEVFLATDECNICLCQNGEVECVVKRECSDLTKTPRKLDVNY